MPAPQRPSVRPTPPRPISDAMERLYVYWLISTALLLVVVLIVGILLRGALHQQAAVIMELSDRVATLETAVHDLQFAQTARPLEPRERLAPEQPATSGPTRLPSPAAPAPNATTRPAIPAPPPPVTSEPAALSEDTLRTQLDDLLPAEPATPDDIRRPDAGLELLDRALKSAGRARWSGAAWSRLAVLARLLGRDAVSKVCADRASAAGEPLVTYDEVTAREMLARGQARDALPVAARLVERTAGSPTSQVLRAAALLATDNPASADEALQDLNPSVILDTYDMLTFARALFTLEHWQRLDELLKTLRDVPASLTGEYSFLIAVSLARSGRTVEALAILDGLLPAQRRAPATSPATATTVPTQGWPAPGPDRYEIEVWRGVTLMYAQQPESARHVLQQAAESDPGRPDAHYYLGLLEGRAGRPQVAMAHLKNALASSARMTPAWEALAVLEIDNGQINLALEHLGKAIATNPRRASAHFLAAIAHAKLSHPDPAAEELRRAIHLDERIISEAKQTDVLLRLFTPEQMDKLVAEPSSAPAS